MIEETGTVIAVSGDKIQVSTQVKTTCGSCQAAPNCGTSVIAKAFSRKPEILEFVCEQRVEIGQQVRLGISESALLAASAMVYMLPLLALILSAALFGWLLPIVGLEHELWLIVAVLVTNLASFVWVSGLIKRNNQGQYQPTLLEVLPVPQIPQNPIPVRHL